MRALQQLGFDEWAVEVRASHEEFKEEAKSELCVMTSLCCECDALLHWGYRVIR